MVKKLSAIIITTLLSAYLSSISNVEGLQIVLKRSDWYCFTMNADPHTVYEVDYSITGVNPEEVEFKATQSEHVVSEKGKRSLQITLESSDDKQASFCWRRTDKKSKKLDFYIKRNLPHSADVADRNTLDSMEQDI